MSCDVNYISKYNNDNDVFKIERHRTVVKGKKISLLQTLTQFLKENDLVPERLALTGRITQYPTQLCVIISETRRPVTCLSLHDLKISDWFKHNTDIRCKRWHR